MHSQFRYIGFFASLCSLMPSILHSQQGQRGIKVPDATALRLVLSDPLSSATNEVDDPVRFEVTEEVKVGGIVVIAKGSTAVGHVVEVEPKRRLGRAGKLNFTLDHVKAVDGSNLRLRASSTRKGDDKTGTVIVGTVLLTPLFLIMRGKDVSIPQGMAMIAYIDGDRDIQLSSDVSAAGDAPVIFTQAAGPALPAEKQDPSTVVLKSDPAGAEIIIDGKIFGNTPSTLLLPPGDHLFSLQRDGYQLWQRVITVTSGGIVTVTGVLDRKAAGSDGDLKANRQVPN
jgi:hypothetical protein